MLARSIGANIKRHRGIPPTTHMKKKYKSIIKQNNYCVTNAGYHKDGDKLIPVTLVWNGIDGFTVSGCFRKRRRAVKRFAIEIADVKYVVCGYAASHTQYLVPMCRVKDLVLDHENGEQIMSHPMRHNEAWKYIHG